MIKVCLKIRIHLILQNRGSKMTEATKRAWKLIGNLRWRSANYQYNVSPSKHHNCIQDFGTNSTY
jgi:hypothetical protein